MVARTEPNSFGNSTVGTLSPEDSERVRSLGFSPRLFERVIACLDTWVKEGKIPGVQLGIARRNQPAWYYQVGFANLESKQAFTPDTFLRLASASKPIVALAFLRLMERGACQLHDPVSKYCQEIRRMRVFKGVDAGQPVFMPLEEEMTLAHLLTHTSGLGYDFNVPRVLKASYQTARPFADDATMDDLLKYLVSLPLVFSPGKGFQYGLSTDLLGCVLERIAKQPLSELLHELVFAPLGMHRTGFGLPRDTAAQLAPLYKLVGKSHFVRADRGDASRYVGQSKIFLGGSGLISTATDFMRFAEVLNNDGVAQGQRLIRAEGLRLMTSNQLDPGYLPFSVGPGMHYDTEGYGFGLNLKVLTHPRTKDYLAAEGEFGWAGATNTYFWVDPRHELAVLVFCQFVPFAPFALEQEFKKVFYDALLV